MSNNNIQLTTSSIIKVPFHIYENDFTFIVNGQEFKTTKVISDILSKKISNIHASDPTFNSFIINTKSNGNFYHILGLVNFNEYQIKDNEIQFFTEVFEILDTDSFSFSIFTNDEITSDNVINLLKGHEKSEMFYSEQIKNEIDYICLHFFELCDTYKDEISSLKFNILEQIISSSKLLLVDEDQLLKFVNYLYQINSNNSELYDYVNFLNVSSSSISEFASVFNVNDISTRTWQNLLVRLEQNLNNTNFESDKRYCNIFPVTDNFTGIINYLQKKTSGNISDEVIVEPSSEHTGKNEQYHPLFVTIFDDRNKFFASDNKKNSYLCFEFKKSRIIPTGYRLMSRNCGHYIKNWKIEVSDDKKDWDEISNEDSMLLVGAHNAHTFNIKKPNNKFIKYFKITQIGENSNNDNYFCIDSIEIFGIIQRND